MQNPISVATAVAEKVTAIAAVAEAVNSNIVVWDGPSIDAEYRTLDEYLRNITPPMLVIAHVLASMGRRGSVPRWQHTIGIWILTESRASAYKIAKDLMDGKAAGHLIPFIELELHSACDPLQDPVLQWTPVSQDESGNVSEAYYVSFSLIESGGAGY